MINISFKDSNDCERALLRRLTVNTVKQVFFTDKKNFYLNPPVNTQNDHLWAKGKKKEVASS